MENNKPMTVGELIYLLNNYSFSSMTNVTSLSITQDGIKFISEDTIPIKDELEVLN